MGIVEAFGGGIIAGSLFVGVVLIVGGAILRLFGLYITDKVLSGMEFAAILSVILLLMGGAIAVGGPLSLALLLLVAALALLITLMPQIAGRVRGYQMLRGDIQRLEEDLRRQPDVPLPHLKHGEIYYEQEDWDRANEHNQAYIATQEQSGDAKRRLERCVERKRIRDLGLRRCPVCGAENKRTNARCVECGFYLKGMVEVLDTLVTPEMMVIWKWLAIVFLLPAVAVGVFAQVITPTLPMAMLACSIIATVIFLYGRKRAEGGRRY